MRRQWSIFDIGYIGAIDFVAILKHVELPEIIRDQILNSIEFNLGRNSKDPQKTALDNAIKKEFSKNRGPVPWQYADKNNPGSPPPKFIL